MQNPSIPALFLCAALAAQESHAFLPNRGQWPPSVHALVRHAPLSTWLSTTGFTTQVLVDDTPWDPRGSEGPHAPRRSPRCGLVHVDFVGGLAARAEFGRRMPGVVAFFLGDDPSRWAEDVPRHDTCVLPDVWPGIDVRFGSRREHVAYDFVLARGADPGAIALRIRGASGVELGADGALDLDLGFGMLRHSRPIAFQTLPDGTQREFEARFTLDGERIGFAVDGHDPDLPLTIDPSLLWTSMFGGNGNDGTAYRQVLDRDAAGNLVFCGYTGSSNFPGPAVGTWDGFVTALDANGTLRWTALLGGTNPGDEWLRACRWDGAGGVFFGGSSASDFPTTAGALQPTNSGPMGPNQWGDMVVGHLAPTPTGVTLAWSTFLGGSGQETVNGLCVLPGGRVAVTGWSDSPGLWTHAGAAQPATRGAFNAYFAVLDRNLAGAAQRPHATWWGGMGTDDAPGCLLLDGSGLLVCGGYTNAQDLATTASAIQPTYQGGSHDGYVVAFDPTLSSAVYCSYLGGPGYDQANDMAIDRAGRWVVANWTGGGFSAPIVFSGCSFQPTFAGGGDDGYVLVLDPWQPPAQQLVWGTYLGGSLRDGINGVAIDDAGRISVVGAVETRRNSAMTSFPRSAWALQTQPAAGQFDAFVARFDPRRCGNDQLVYSTLLGGNGFDYAYDVVLDERSRPIVLGATSSTTFPPGVPRPGGSQDVFVTQLDLLATVADRLGAPSPSCSTAFLDAYHQQIAGGFDVTFTCSVAPSNAIGLLLIGLPDAAGAPVPGLAGIVSHLQVGGPLLTFAVLTSDTTGHSSHRVQAPLTPPVGLAVQSAWFGGCVPTATSDAIRF